MNFRKKIIKNCLVFIFSVGLFSACARNKVNLASTVEFNAETISNSPTISIDEQQVVNVYGPIPISNEKSFFQSNKSTWGLVVLPARSRVFELIKILKLFETYNLSPNLIVAYEYSALLMVAFTQKMRVGELEWLIYQSFSKEESNIERWAQGFKNELKLKLGDLNLDKSSPMLVLPMWNASQGKEVFVDSGQADSWLRLMSLDAKSFDGHIAGWLKIFNLDKIRQHYGLDKLVVIDLFGDKIIFNKNDDYLHGVYGTYLSVKKAKIVSDKNTIVLNLSSDGVDQNQLPVAAEILKSPTDQLDEKIRKLPSLLNEGIEN
jgi:hypothetical protein